MRPPCTVSSSIKGRVGATSLPPAETSRRPVAGCSTNTGSGSDSGDHPSRRRPASRSDLSCPDRVRPVRNDHPRAQARRPATGPAICPSQWTVAPPNQDDAFYVTGMALEVADRVAWEAIALQTLAERSTDERWPGFERQVLFEFRVERCLLTLTHASDGSPAGHTVWHSAERTAACRGVCAWPSVYTRLRIAVAGDLQEEGISRMCCVVAALFTLGPRAAILFWWLVQPVRWEQTFDTFLWPFVGFLILPWTTLMYVLYTRRVSTALTTSGWGSASRWMCSAGLAAGTRTAIGFPRPRPDGTPGSVRDPRLVRCEHADT